MKTPREILLEKHRDAEPKLDALRKQVLAAEFPAPVTRAPAPRFSVRGLAFNIWRELILPCRRVWVGLAATWLVLLICNFAKDTRTELASKAPPPGPVVAAALQEQRQFLARMLEPFPRTPAVPPRTPGPRGALPLVVKLT